MSDMSNSIVAKRHTYGEDCLNCRLVSGFGIIGMGLYVFNAARNQKANLNRNFIYTISLGNLKENKNTSPYKYKFFLLIFLGIIGIGAARLFAFPPFQRTISD